MVFLLLVSVLFRGPLTFLILVGGIGGRGKIKIASASTPSANESAKYLILVHTVQLKPMIKKQISRIMVSNGISDVVTASVHSEKTRLKKLMMMKMIIIIIIGERAKRARHSRVYSLKNGDIREYGSTLYV